jgi:hypothetical protein
MKTCTIKFRATIIALKTEINTQDKDMGSFSGSIYSMLNYLENIGLNFSLSKLYSIKKPVEFLIEGDNLNNVGHNFMDRKLFTELRKDNLPIHVRIERLTPAMPYFNKN